MANKQNHEPGPDEYRALAELRYLLRKFMRFSEQTARASGLEPQQHQLILVLKGFGDDGTMTVGAVAEKLQLKQHSVVELINRTEQRGLVRRAQSEVDRRQVLVNLTPEGEQVLKELSLHHRQELELQGPALVGALTAVLGLKGSKNRAVENEHDPGDSPTV